MTHSTGSSLDQVAALDEERRRYEAWLAQLDERHGTTPERVLQRVRADYQERLRDVVARLGEHAELLRNAVDERARTVDELRAAEQEHQDARAEAELRAMVGEYGPEQWREMAARADEELAGLAERRGAAEEELARLEQVLALARGADAAAPDEADEELAAAPASLEDVAAARTEEWPAASTPPADAAPVADDWRAPEPETAPPRIVERPREVAAPEPAAADWFAEEPALAPPPPPPAGHAASAPPQAKTLRCQECGTMNYPTEWYCERCGGELATL